MKKILSLSIVALLAVVLFSSCNTSKQTLKQFAKFTSSDRLYQVKPGDSYETVVATLGCEPYNLLSKQSDGYDIYVYKYKIVERKCDPETIDQRGAESQGVEVYKSKEENVYLIFEKNKLQSLITEEGLKSGNGLIFINNTLYSVTKNANGEYVIKATDIKPTVGDSEKKAPAIALPTGKK